MIIEKNNNRQFSRIKIQRDKIKKNILKNKALVKPGEIIKTHKQDHVNGVIQQKSKQKKKFYKESNFERQ